MKTGLVIGLVILAAFASYTKAVAVEEAGNPDITLKNLTLGDTVFGEQYSLEALRHRVVLVEFWGINCGPCIASIPKLSNWQDTYKSKGLVVIGVHCQRASNEALKALAKEKGVTYTIVSSGKVAGSNFSGIPHCFLFDSTGECVYEGSPFRAQEHLKDALARAPFAALGDREFVKLRSISEGLERGMTPARAFKKAEEMLNSPDAETAEEAKYIVSALTTWGQKLIDNAMGAKDDDPVRCVTGLYVIRKRFEGTDLGKQASTKLAELKKDVEFQSELKARRVLGRITSIEDTLMRIGRDRGTTGSNFRKRNYAALSSMRKGVLLLRKKYPDTKAAAEATTIAEKYALLKK